MENHEEVLAEMRATPSRRIIGAVAMGGLGLLLLRTALFTDPSPGLQIGLVVAGAAALFATQVMWRATSSAVELTAEGLRDADGTIIARLDDIAVADRGVFAFKPSNGFTLKLHQSAPVVWRLGLWWRWGKRVGIGGMTPAHQAKIMEERITTLRGQNDPQA